jgi:hypothetical protein
LLSADEGSVSSSALPAELTPLYFSWSATNQDNWVTNASTCPGPTYTDFGNDNGAVYSPTTKTAAEAATTGFGLARGLDQLQVVAFINGAGNHHMVAATAKSKLWAARHGYTAQKVLGWVDPPVGATPTHFVLVPSSVLAPSLSKAEEAREAMRKRLYEPTVPWQTYVTPHRW